MRLQLQPYSYQVQYKPGKELYLADTLSRAPGPREYSTDLSPCHEGHVHSILSYAMPASTVKEKYASATKEDSTLQLVIGLTENGWPEHKQDCPVSAKPFWSERAIYQLQVAFSFAANRWLFRLPLGRTCCDRFMTVISVKQSA